MPKSELESFADETAHNAFEPLFQNDVFWLNHLKYNPNAYWAFYEEIMDRWIIVEENEDTDTDEEIFELMCNEEKNAN